MGEDRQHRGNEGYDDLVHAYYSFDSTVPNSRKVSPGDVAVVRDNAVVLGAARIVRLLETAGQSKKRHRCPECDTTDIKERYTIAPRYRCGRGHTFDHRVVEDLVVTRYRAMYDDTWRGATGLTVTEIDAAYLGRAAQHAIRQLDMQTLRPMLEPKGLWPV